MIQCWNINIQGLVQGVGFRYFTCQWALKFNLLGWVRNRSNGEVQVLVQGRIEKLEEFIKLLQKGPEGSQVRGIEKRLVPLRKDLKTFSLKHTE